MAVRIHPKDIGLALPRTLKPRAKAKPKGPSEATIQAQVEAYCDRLGLFYIRIPNEVYKATFGWRGTRSGPELGALKEAASFMRGVPDLTILKDGRYLAIELKRDTGKLSQAQKLWRAAIGTVAAYSFEEAREAIDSWLAPRA